MAVISLFGFLNRWSDTMKSELEAKPLERVELSEVSCADIAKARASAGQGP